MSSLTVSNLGKSFGGLRALSGLDLTVNSGEVFGLIGPNGSGKTTTVNVLTGIFAPTSGTATLDAHTLTTLSANQIVRRGLARTFQNLRLFGTRSVIDNVRVAQSIHCRSFGSQFNALMMGQERALSAEAAELVERFGLGARRHWPAAALSYGEKKRLEMARALATRPKFLLLDEPAAGMNAVETDGLRAMIDTIRRSGIGIILIEHHMKLVMDVCDRIAVLNFGQKIAEGTPAEIARDPQVIESYLGKAD